MIGLFSQTALNFQQVADSLGDYTDCAKVLGYLYNCEILEEDSIVSWFNKDAGDGIKAQVILHFKSFLHLLSFVYFLRKICKLSSTGYKQQTKSQMNLIEVLDDKHLL